jgi:hypothetical protein
MHVTLGCDRIRLHDTKGLLVQEFDRQTLVVALNLSLNAEAQLLKTAILVSASITALKLL